MRSNSKLMLPCLFLSIIYFSVRTLRAPFSSARSRTSGYLSRQRVDLVRIRALFFPSAGVYFWVALRVRPRTCFFSTCSLCIALGYFRVLSLLSFFLPSPTPLPFLTDQPQALQDTRSEAWTDSMPEHVCRLLHARRKKRNKCATNHTRHFVASFPFALFSSLLSSCIRPRTCFRFFLATLYSCLSPSPPFYSSPPISSFLF